RCSSTRNVMSCQDLDQTLLPYLYDELSAGERAAYDAHLASCSDCRSALEESRRLHQVLGQRPALEPTPEMIVRCRQALDEAPDPKTGDVRITLNAERRVTLEGSLDDPQIQQLLVGAVKGYENAGIRRDTLDVLRARSDNPSVRAALLYVMRHDANPGVRLE